MSFSNDINDFARNTSEKINVLVEDKKREAEDKLVEILGDKLDEIKSITLDLDTGKFKDIEASEHVKELLRKADLLIE